MEKESLREVSLKYSVDQILLSSDYVSMGGWGISTACGRPPVYRICTEQGEAVPLTFHKTRREDASLSVWGDGRDLNCGFDIRFRYEEKQDYYWIIENGIDELRVFLDIRELKKKQAKAMRPYQPVKKILKSYRLKELKADLGTWRRDGAEALKDQWKIRYASGAYGYDVWRLKRKTSGKELERQREAAFDYEPLVSIIVPAYKTPKAFLHQMIGSVKEQTYRKWELCIADGGAAEDDTVEKEMQAYRKDGRIRYKRLAENRGISGNTNEALEMARGQVIMLLDHDDLLSEEALFEFVRVFNEDPEADVAYSDEDKVSLDLKHYFDPHFKPDFNPDLLRSNNYICHLFAAKSSVVKKAGVFCSEFDGAQDYDFILRCVEQSRKVAHIPRVLYHWRMHPLSTAANPESKMYCYEAGRRAIEEHLKRRQVSASVGMQEQLGYYYVDYELKGEPLVSILIPNRDEKECLRRCVESVLTKTKYRNYEILILENNSEQEETFAYYRELEKDGRIRILRWESGFNYSAINNFGVENARGEYCLLLNNDTEVLSPEWLGLMLADCQRPEIGAVGAKLLYPDDTIQHGGVVLGLGGIAGHIFSRQPEWVPGYFARAILQQDYSAVTGACLMVERERYRKLGGLEEMLTVAFNDVDFCLRLGEAGFLVMYEPRARLYHHESLSRGGEDTPDKKKRFSEEEAFMRKRWGTLLESGDPCYNRNLTLSSGDCSLKVDETEASVLY